MKILIVEDNPLLGSSLKQGLSELDWTVDLARDGEEGLYLAENGHYDLLLVDRMLPKLSGTDLILTLRKKDDQTPIIMVTARGELEDRVSGLEQGADDYVVKPFEFQEVVARIKAVHRRSLGKGQSGLKFHRLAVDVGGRTVFSGEIRVDLTSKEFDLLCIFLNKPGKVFSRTELSGLLYEFNDEPESNSIDVLMARLRKKIAGSGVELATVRSKGFIFRVDATAVKP